MSVKQVGMHAAAVPGVQRGGGAGGGGLAPGSHRSERESGSFMMSIITRSRTAPSAIMSESSCARAARHAAGRESPARTAERPRRGSHARMQRPSGGDTAAPTRGWERRPGRQQGSGARRAGGFAARVAHLSPKRDPARGVLVGSVHLDVVVHDCAAAAACQRVRHDAQPAGLLRSGAAHVRRATRRVPLVGARASPRATREEGRGGHRRRSRCSRAR